VSKLYDEVLLDHICNARNYRAIEHAPVRTGEVVNPLCGDRLTVYLQVQGDTIQDAAFQCECCGVSMASASVMTEWVKGRSVAAALAARRAFEAAVNARQTEALPDAPAGHAAVLHLLAHTPSRKGCGLLAWTALEQALGGERATAEAGTGVPAAPD
jgi:nitrogen fixation NifU-like protein